MNAIQLTKGLDEVSDLEWKTYHSRDFEWHVHTLEESPWKPKREVFVFVNSDGEIVIEAGDLEAPNGVFLRTKVDSITEIDDIVGMIVN